jgi:hypothetical protein
MHRVAPGRLRGGMTADPHAPARVPQATSTAGTGLIKVIKAHVPNGHWLLAAGKQTQYKDQLNILVALRDYAARESPTSKRQAISATDQQQIGCRGDSGACSCR